MKTHSVRLYYTKNNQINSNDMKKIITTIIAVCLTITVSSCGTNESKSSEEKKCAEKNCENSNCSEQQLETSDLTLFGLKGNVKAVTDEIGNTYNFTKEGKLDLPESQIKRDDSGKIVSYTVDELTTEVAWDQDGYVTETNLPGQKTTFTYDDRGLLLTSYTEVDSWELSIYKYLKFDEKGNWTERERTWLGYSAGAGEGEDPIYRNKEVEKRTIVYY